MNADAIRHFYGYHFAMNRFVWERYIKTLDWETFTQHADYSHGSVREQLLHLIDVDRGWFIPLLGLDFPEEWPEAEDYKSYEEIEAYWDEVKVGMQGYLAGLQDEMLGTKPYPPGEDENLILWQVLLHVVNHGTDHRAQILRLLNDLGVETTSQDYIFYVYEVGEGS